jgi:hypothetical protein
MGMIDPHDSSIIAPTHLSKSDYGKWLTSWLPHPE